MSLTEFQAKLASDKAFADQVKQCNNAEKIIAVAKDAGIELSNTDIAKALASAAPVELTDEDLESVSSGTVMAVALIK
jgi:predicted ribosomally synthesized peptide with nif11-like leader